MSSDAQVATLGPSGGPSEPPCRTTLRALLTPGVRAMLWSSFFFSVMSLMVKVVGQRISSIQLGLLRGFLCFGMTWVLLRRASIPPFGRQPKLLVARGLFGFIGVQCYFYSVVHLALDEATVIHYLHPILIAILAALFLKERVSKRLIVAVLSGFLGVMWLTGYLPARLGLLADARSTPLHFWGLMAGLIGALASAFAYLTVRKLAGREHTNVVVLYLTMVTSALSLPFAIGVWVWPTPTEWLQLCLMAVATQLGQMKITQALHLEPAGKMTTLGYSQIVYATLWNMMIFGHFPTWLTLVGAIAIGIAVYLASSVNRNLPNRVST